MVPFGVLPSAPTDLVFGKYEIIKRLAVGGMGEIFLARESNAIGVDRLVILKNLLPDLAKQPDFISAFLDEARVAATLNHPNIVSMYEVGAWKGVYYICMEYIEGENLNGVLDVCDDRGERLPPRIAARIIRDAAMGLAHAHDATKTDGSRLEIVHRDVSPHNIMVRLDGVTKVVDFGIALATTRQTRTATGHIKGKVRYLAPEQIEGHPLDGRTDQYSLGIVFWELLTGVPAYEGENGSILYRKIGNEPLRGPSTIVADLPKAFDDIIATMTATDPAKRYPDCRAVARVIEDEIFGSLQLSSNEAHVGELITELVGEAMAQRRRELTPNDFVVSLEKTEPAIRERGRIVTEDATKKVTPPSRRGRFTLIAAVVLALGAAAVFAVYERRPVPAPAVASAPPISTSPPPIAAAEPEREPEPDPEPQPQSPTKRTAKQSTIANTRPGFLSVRTVPWTRVSIAGRDYGSTPVLKIELPPGKQTLTLVNEEKHINEQKVVDIRPGKTSTLNIALKGTP